MRTYTLLGRIFIPILIAFSLFSFLLWFSSCDREPTGLGNENGIIYTLIVSDSLDNHPLDSILVEVQLIRGDILSFSESKADGKIISPIIYSNWVQFTVASPGYEQKIFIDSVRSVPDTAGFGEPLNVVLRLKLLSLEDKTADTLQPVQHRFFIRDQDLQPLQSGQITYTDSLGREKSVLDHNQDGLLTLSDLGLGDHWVKIIHPGFSGRQFYIPLQNANPDSGQKVIFSYQVSLDPLNYTLQGQVFRQEPGKGEVAHAGQRVQFIISDSLLFPRKIETLTDSLGYFSFDSLPARSGNLQYFSGPDANEPALVSEISKEQLVLESPLKAVVLPSPETTEGPIVLSTPNDTIQGKTDTLTFVFNQAIDEDSIQSVDIRRINDPAPILISQKLSPNQKDLNIIPPEGGWQAGKLYQYELNIRNASELLFSRPGSSSPNIKGTFWVPVSNNQDSVLTFPKNLRLAYFHAGENAQFDSTHNLSTPLADSMSEMTRLSWIWPQNQNPTSRVDSISLYYRDTHEGQNGTINWSLWKTYPAAAESVVVFFSDKYSTVKSPSALKPAFPPKESLQDTLWFQAIPKEGNRLIQDSSKTLKPITQGMGASVYSYFNVPDSLYLGSQAGSDTIEVIFSSSAIDSTEFFPLDTAAIKPVLSTNFAPFQLDNILTWRWTGLYKGEIVYKVVSESPSYSWIGVSVDLQTYQNKPLWHKNKNKKVYLEP